GQGGVLSYVGGPPGVQVEGQELFFAHVHLHGGPAPVRRFLPTLIDLVLNGKVNPGKVFDLTLPLAQVAEGYRAMDERRAIKTLLQPQVAERWTYETDMDKNTRSRHIAESPVRRDVDRRRFLKLTGAAGSSGRSGKI